MEETLFNYLSSQGIFAVLFAGLLIDWLKTSKERENHYREINKDLNETLVRLENMLDELLKKS
ncbi:BhlA/UviB family holin-like peptide [Bacillus infantis]|uniref:BhlA/UviB family holin-like peptide n=1 Tax=Bacillus infantis TaxID=324767 RepID=UPI00209E071A|nr:BhlA/UviB family holin-like peptide [Bacillus infantis]MCP1161344.1 BhlA/UviB family holin-like peptide [Bacillus infantis]